MAQSGDTRRPLSLALDLLRQPKGIWREIGFLLKGDCVGYYDLLGDDVLEGQDQAFSDSDKPLWLNLGYWKEARTYPDAGAAMARLLADAACLGEEDTVLDVGFGFAEQDLFWVENYRVKRIIGLNITPLHVNVARQRVEQRGLTERIDLRLGNALDLPFDDGSLDKVVALECAFHFDTRTQFFEQAHRVLRPGGMLALADIVPMVGERPGGLIQRLGMRRWGIPWANMYDREVYCERLRERGFSQVTAQSIRHHVFPGMDRYAEQRRQGRDMKDIVIDLTEQEIADCRGLEAWAQIGLTDYVIFAAQKPAA